VFLLVGPATNVASLTVLTGILGKRATAIYLGTIAVSAVFFGLVVDHVYAVMGISAQAMVGQASEVVPLWAQQAGVLLVLFLSIKPLYRMITPITRRLSRAEETPGQKTVSGISDSDTPVAPSQCGPT
jgi:hypothetical protein